MVLRSEKQEKMGKFGMANFAVVGRDWHSPLLSNQSQVAAVAIIFKQTYLLSGFVNN